MLLSHGLRTDCRAAGLAATVALVYLGLPRLFTKDAAVAAGVRPLTLQVHIMRTRLLDAATQAVPYPAGLAPSNVQLP